MFTCKACSRGDSTLSTVTGGARARAHESSDLESPTCQTDNASTCKYLQFSERVHISHDMYIIRYAFVLVAPLATLRGRSFCRRFDRGLRLTRLRAFAVQKPWLNHRKLPQLCCQPGAGPAEGPAVLAWWWKVSWGRWVLGRGHWQSAWFET